MSKVMNRSVPIARASSTSADNARCRAGQDGPHRFTLREGHANRGAVGLHHAHSGSRQARFEIFQMRGHPRRDIGVDDSR